MAVGLEWSHAELLGQVEGLAIVECSRRSVRVVAMGGDLAQQSESPRLATALLVLTAERQGAPSESARLGAATDEQIDLAQAGEGERHPGIGTP